MIFDQLQTLDELLRDPAEGLTQTVQEVANAKGVIVPLPGEISTWRIKWPGEFAAYPALQQFWREAPRMELKTQGAWDGDFGFQWVLWFQVADVDVQKHIAIYMHAIRRILDRVPGRGTIKEVSGVRAADVPMREVGSQYAGVAIEFFTTELDMQP